MRVPAAPILTGLFQALGAGPTPININEVYSALQTNVVEGQENPLAIIATAKLNEVQKYCSLTSHVWDAYLILGNRRSFQRLPGDAQEIVTREMNKSAEAERADIAALSKSLRDDLAAKGLQFVEVDKPAFRAALGKTTFYKVVYRSFLWQELYPALVRTAALSGTILFIIGAATCVSWALTQSNFSHAVAAALAGIPGGRFGFLLGSIVLFIVLGSVLEGIPAMVLFGPLLFPVVKSLGVHEVHYAMVVILAMGIGLFAPPFGLGYYAACSIGQVDPNVGLKHPELSRGSTGRASGGGLRPLAVLRPDELGPPTMVARRRPLNLLSPAMWMYRAKLLTGEWPMRSAFSPSMPSSPLAKATRASRSAWRKPPPCCSSDT